MNTAFINPKIRSQFMSHHQDHDHHHDHDHAPTHAPLTFTEKMAKLLDHWIQHNEHHAEDYRQWAQEARQNNQVVVAEQLESAAELTETISGRFRKAAETVRPD